MKTSQFHASSPCATFFEKDSHIFHKWSRRTLSTIFIMMMAVASLASCINEPASPTVPLPANAVIIDVRTPEEYAAGHLESAQLIDLTGGDFAKALPTLDPAGTYFVYCRSGNRSAQAVTMMEDAGFSNVTDLGAMERASEITGTPIVE